MIEEDDRGADSEGGVIVVALESLAGEAAERTLRRMEEHRKRRTYRIIGGCFESL